jgi:hypothetical protein
MSKLTELLAMMNKSFLLAAVVQQCMLHQVLKKRSVVCPLLPEVHTDPK